MSNGSDFELSRFLPYLLNQAAELVGQDFSTAYKDRYGMLRTEWRVLAHLGEFGDLSATQVGALARVHKTKISRAVAALEAKRFIVRHEIVTDRRSAVLQLTKAGRAAYQDLSRLALAHNDKLADIIGESDYRTLITCLQRLGHIAPPI